MSEDERESRTKLRLVRTDEPGESRLASIRLVVRGPAWPPFAIGAIAVEDDTYAVLGADPRFREPTEHPLRIWTAVHEAAPAVPGSVAVYPGDPVRLHAVVHDLSLDPTWREAWVEEALDEILQQVEQLGVTSLGLPPLGAVHGRLALDRFLMLLRQAVDRNPPVGLGRIWLIASPETEEELTRAISRSSTG